MYIESVDQDKTLFRVTDVFSVDLVEQVLSTPWQTLDYGKQESQETWPRRKIHTNQLSWFPQWETQLQLLWQQLETDLKIKLNPYGGTVFWLDEPGFTCPIHTDGEMPGSLHLTWIGDSRVGTTFYNSKRSDDVRYQVDLQPNAGYIMINVPNDSGYRLLQWHGMLFPVPKNSYRLTSYTWLLPCV